ncbi:MAG TPA: hypothetical protein VGR20_02355 [Acidimicrobiia bacterium]|nr:hypothetical protein [Acidimicrobiia bacterium]
MEDWFENDNRLRALAMRVAALEDNIAFLEEWCEEQQDILDRSAGPAAYDYEPEPEPEPPARVYLRVVDLRDEVLAVIVADEQDPGDDGDDSGTIIAMVETEHDRKVRQIRARLDRLRVRMVVSAPGDTPAVGG